jgi:hypothetical protein
LELYRYANPLCEKWKWKSRTRTVKDKGEEKDEIK